MFYFKKAHLSDIALMQEIVKKEVEAKVILPRSDDEIATAIRSYTLVFAEQNEAFSGVQKAYAKAQNAALGEGVLVGYSALHIHTAKLAEVRSLIIADEFRAQGVGARLVGELLKEAHSLGLSEVFTLTYRRHFFEKLGFVEISKQELPEQKIWADCIKCKRFPVCDEIALITKVKD